MAPICPCHMLLVHSESHKNSMQVVYGCANDRFGGCGSILRIHEEGCGGCGGCVLTPGH